jgi:hypothetical protein
MRIIVVVLAVVSGMLAAAPAGAAIPPSNDDFARAEQIDVGTVTFRSLGDATLEAGEPAHGVNTVWYVFRPSETRRVAFEIVEAADMEAILSVYEGSSFPSLELVGRGSVFPARVTFEALAGATYRVAVGKEQQWPGSNFGLRLRSAEPPYHDAFADAKRVKVPGEYEGTLFEATAEPREDPDHNHSVWYSLRPNLTGEVTVELRTAGYGAGRGADARDCSLRLYGGRGLSTLKVIAVEREDPTRAANHRLQATLRRGVDYRLALDATNPGSVTTSSGSSRPASRAVVSTSGLMPGRRYGPCGPAGCAQR